MHSDTHYSFWFQACASLQADYQPRITFVVVQKRHHTRLFPFDHSKRDQMDRSGNILPGLILVFVVMLLFLGADVTLSIVYELVEISL